MRLWRRYPLRNILGVVALGVVLFALWRAEHPLDIYKRKALPAMQLQTLEGELISTADWQPPYILNIFASWCAPCLQELPQLQRLSGELPIHAVAWNDSPQAVRQWIAQHEPPFNSVTLDHHAELYRTLMVGGVPITLVVGRDHKIAYAHEGAIREQDITPFMRAIFDVR